MYFDYEITYLCSFLKWRKHGDQWERAQAAKRTNWYWEDVGTIVRRKKKKVGVKTIGTLHWMYCFIRYDLSHFFFNLDFTLWYLNCVKWHGFSTSLMRRLFQVNERIYLSRWDVKVWDLVIEIVNTVLIYHYAREIITEGNAEDVNFSLPECKECLASFFLVVSDNCDTLL